MHPSWPGGPSSFPTQSSRNGSAVARCVRVPQLPCGGVVAPESATTRRCVNETPLSGVRTNSGEGGDTPDAMVSRLAAAAIELPRTAWKTDSAVSTSATPSTASLSASSAS